MVAGPFSEGNENILQKDSTGSKFVVRIQGFAAEKLLQQVVDVSQDLPTRQQRK
jgi:hypothetical protein